VYHGGMRTNIDIDEELLAEAQRIAGTTTKRSTVEYALRELVRRKDRQAVLRLHGQVEWTGDLDESRQSRTA
jgi:Arc/MetJ family transcription regulator